MNGDLRASLNAALSASLATVFGVSLRRPEFELALRAEAA
jgi:hypothetical protein